LSFQSRQYTFMGTSTLLLPTREYHPRGGMQLVHKTVQQCNDVGVCVQSFWFDFVQPVKHDHDARCMAQFPGKVMHREPLRPAYVVEETLEEIVPGVMSSAVAFPT